MLTILWRKPNGAEVIISAHSVEHMQEEGEECVPVHTNRFRICRDDSLLPSEIIIEKPFGAMFVMNKHGATVARYLAN